MQLFCLRRNWLAIHGVYVVLTNQNQGQLQLSSEECKEDMGGHAFFSHVAL